MAGVHKLDKQAKYNFSGGNQNLFDFAVQRTDLFMMNKRDTFYKLSTPEQSHCISHIYSAVEFCLQNSFYTPEPVCLLCHHILYLFQVWTKFCQLSIQAIERQDKM